MNNKSLHKWVLCALIAAVYAAASLAIPALSFSGMQCRISEALVLLPLIYPPSILGVTLGCLITNAIGVFLGANILGVWDVLFGTLATLIAAYGTYKFAKVKFFNIPLISILMPVVVNGIVIGAELAFVLSPNGFDMTLFFINGGLVALGELVAVVIFGLPLVNGLSKTQLFK